MLDFLLLRTREASLTLMQMCLIINVSLPKWSGGSVNLCITQKNEKLLLELAIIYNGKVYNHYKSSNNYRFIISNKSSVLAILNDYFSKYPSMSMKQNRLMLIKKYYELRTLKCHLAPKNSSMHKV